MLNLGVDLEPGDTPGPAKGAHEALGESVLNPGVTWNLGDLETGDTPDPAKGAHEAPWKLTDLEPGGTPDPAEGAHEGLGVTWNLG